MSHKSRGIIPILTHTGSFVPFINTSGPGRLCWIRLPVVRKFMTYQHALEAFRTHCTFIPENDKKEILGGTLQRLLSHAGR